MRLDEQQWVKRREGLIDCHDDIDLESDFIADLCAATGYDARVAKGGELFHQWENDKNANIVTYRDQQYVSLFTGNKAPKHKPWYEDFDDSLVAYIN